jgi:poly(3-hydroxybutyrate) depolymerase
MQFPLWIAIMAASLTMTAEAYVAPRSLSIPVLAGCGKPLPSGQALGAVSNVTITSGGVQRSYLIFIPPGYNSFIPTPIIFSYHGGVRNASDQLELDQFTNPYFNTVSLVVYPQGINV